MQLDSLIETSFRVCCRQRIPIDRNDDEGDRRRGRGAGGQRGQCQRGESVSACASWRDSRNLHQEFEMTHRSSCGETGVKMSLPVMEVAL